MSEHLLYSRGQSLRRRLENNTDEVMASALKPACIHDIKTVEAFEKGFASYSNTGHCIGVSSGAVAMRFALLASGVQRGDIVLTVPNTIMNAMEVILETGAIPHFIDVNEKTHLMDMQKLEEYLSGQCMQDVENNIFIHRVLRRPVRAVIPVHLNGLMADMDTLMELSRKYGLIVIEDAGQAYGARYYSKISGKWEVAGSLGHASVFDFSPESNFGSSSEAGAVITNSDTISSKIRSYRDHGHEEGRHAETGGCYYQLDALGAMMLAIKLKHIDYLIACRRKAASWYKEMLTGMTSLITPYEPMDCIGVFNLYVIRTGLRDRLMAFLATQGISTGVNYPLPLHKKLYFKHYGVSLDMCPVAEKLSHETLSLPIYPEFEKPQAEKICTRIKDFFKTVDVDKKMKTYPLIV